MSVQPYEWGYLAAIVLIAALAFVLSTFYKDRH